MSRGHHQRENFFFSNKNVFQKLISKISKKRTPRGGGVTPDPTPPRSSHPKCQIVCHLNFLLTFENQSRRNTKCQIFRHFPKTIHVFEDSQTDRLTNNCVCIRPSPSGDFQKKKRWGWGVKLDPTSPRNHDPRSSHPKLKSSKVPFLSVSLVLRAKHTQTSKQTNLMINFS